MPSSDRPRHQPILASTARRELPPSSLPRGTVINSLTGVTTTAPPPRLNQGVEPPSLPLSDKPPRHHRTLPLSAADSQILAGNLTQIDGRGEASAEWFLARELMAEDGEEKLLATVQHIVQTLRAAPPP
jgi:hypothetical protein